MRTGLGRRMLRSNVNQRCDLLNNRVGRRSLPPASIRRRRRGGQWQYRGVSDHEIWPRWRSRPRPRRWSLTPRCLCLSRSGWSSDAYVRAALKACEIRVVNSGRRTGIVRLATRRAQGAPRFLGSAPPALRAADGLDHASREPFGRQLSTAAREVLDDGQQRRYCRIIFAGCDSQPPPHRPMWSSVRIGGLRPRFVPHFSNHFLVRLLVRRHVREADDRIGLRFGLRPGADPLAYTRFRNHHAATAIRLSDVDASGAALSAPTSTADERRHRRSGWAGVSWPKDDDAERDAGGGNWVRARAKEIGRSADARRTSRFARSFAPWRGRLHASVSSWNEAAVRTIQ